MGGALNNAISAILLSDILFEPPFKENLWLQKESITAQITRQGRLSLKKTFRAPNPYACTQVQTKLLKPPSSAAGTPPKAGFCYVLLV
jgi:hypothetical protein